MPPSSGHDTLPSSREFVFYPGREPSPDVCYQNVILDKGRTCGPNALSLRSMKKLLLLLMHIIAGYIYSKFLKFPLDSPPAEKFLIFYPLDAFQGTLF